MKNFRKTLIWLSLILLLPGIGILSSCGDSSKNETKNANQAQEKTLGQSRSMRGIQPVSKSAAKAQQRRLAVVIGNSAYEKSKLKNPVNDAKSMTHLLRRLDFEVELVENGNRRAMISKINDFGRKLRQADVGLFYYAGHGIQVKGRNYLIPTDALLETEADVEFEALDLGRVLGKMEDSNCPLNIVVLDACRDNPFARSFRSVSKGLALVDAPRGTLLAFATAPGSVAADGKGSNGIYTKHLLANIERPDLNIEQVFKQVRIGVVNDTEGQQTPWESSSLMGSFHFQPDHQAKPTIQTQVKEEYATSPEPKTTPKPQQVASIKSKPTAAVKKPKHSAEVQKYIKMLKSSSAKDQRYAAKKICRSYLKNRTLLDVVNRQLLIGYKKNNSDRHHVESMSWFCNVLGRSKQTRYANTLEKVANSDANRKLKKYASKNLRYLQ